MTSTTTEREHAVVIGASIGGLATAAALARHFTRVTVLDRDTLPEQATHRRAVPQSRHAHGVQPGGIDALEALLPGLLDELRAGGVPTGDPSRDCSWTVGGSRFARGTAGATTLGVTRPFLEHRVRSRVAALPGVTIRAGVEVTGLLADDPRRVTGVRAVAGATAERLPADLVVDATGKVSRLPEWLAGLGYDTPAEESVECRMAYLSRRWRLAPERATSDIVTVITPAATPHFGVMIAQEDGTHIVTVGGLLDSGPAREDTAYLDFVAALPDPAIAHALAGAVPVTDLQPAHFPASRRRRYDRLDAFPSGLLAIGDAVACFNPMYGQGMTVAALQATELGEQLDRGPLQARRFFRAAHRIEDAAWKISTGGDLRYPEVRGRRTADMRFMNRYLDRLTAGARTDPELARRFLLVAGFRRPPQSLLSPATVWRVVRARPRTGAGDAAPAPTAPAARTP